MKIKKEFIPLILSGEKQYEIRNSGDKEGVYKIGNEYFKLTKKEKNYYLKFDFNIYNNTQYYINDYNVDKATFDWVKNNVGYFIVNKTLETLETIEVWFYKWEKLEKGIQELEEVE